MARMARALVGAAISIGSLVGCRTTDTQRPDAPQGQAGATPRDEEIAGHLVGRWYDSNWKAVELSVERAGPSSFRMTRVSGDGELHAMRGDLIVCGEHGYLDLTAEAGRPDAPASHQLFKVAWGSTLSIGFEFGDSAKQRQFHHSPVKTFKTLRLVPLQTAYLESHPEALRYEIRGTGDVSESHVVVTASASEIAAFLRAHGGESELWDDHGRSPVMVRK